MTMLSFRVDDSEAAQAQFWSQQLGIDRSELLREALHRHLLRLASENDAVTWTEHPLDPGEQVLTEIADWALPRTGRTGPMQRGEIWFVATPGGDRPVLVLTRDPVADRMGAVVVAALTRTRRHLVSELELTPAEDGVPTECVVNFDNIHSIAKESFRRRIATLSAARMAKACVTLQAATGC